MWNTNRISSSEMPSSSESENFSTFKYERPERPTPNTLKRFTTLKRPTALKQSKAKRRFCPKQAGQGCARSSSSKETREGMSRQTREGMHFMPKETAIRLVIYVPSSLFRNFPFFQFH